MTMRAISGSEVVDEITIRIKYTDSRNTALLQALLPPRLTK
jgi:hypothetical protein